MPSRGRVYNTRTNEERAEIASKMLHLQKQYGLTVAALGVRFGLDGSHVSKMLRAEKARCEALQNA
jgi:hypothetical protein